MLNDPNNSQYISWNPMGGFHIHNLDLLCQHVLGGYFKSILPSNLKRQLQMYGFKMILKHPQSGVLSYIHNENWFHKDKPQLLEKIVMTVKKQRRQSLQTRPFYARKKRPAPATETQSRLNSSGTTDSSSKTEEETNSSYETTTTSSSSSSESQTEPSPISSPMSKKRSWEMVLEDLIRKSHPIETLAVSTKDQLV